MQAMCGKTEMTQAEVRDWLYCLPYFNTYSGGKTSLRRCRNDAERIEVIKDLLANAATDSMSQDDVVICLEALEYLGETLDFCFNCEKPITGLKEHFLVCYTESQKRGRPSFNEVRCGKAVECDEAEDVSELQVDTGDGLEGAEEALPSVLS